MKRVYLGGAIFQADDPVTWRVGIIDSLPVGWEAVDPVTFDINATLENAHEVVARDLRAIDGCDAVFANVCRPSWGTAMEIFYASQCGRPVIGWASNLRRKDISPWLFHHCELVTSDRVKALAYLGAL